MKPTQESTWRRIAHRCRQSAWEAATAKPAWPDFSLALLNMATTYEGYADEDGEPPLAEMDAIEAHDKRELEEQDEIEIARHENRY